MKVTQAVVERRSIRAFHKRPVKRALIETILTQAARAPSGCNMQPWNVWVLAGEALDALKTRVAMSIKTMPEGEPPDYTLFPPGLKPEFRARRSQCAEAMYATIGLTRDNQAGRLRQMAMNYDFFGAPVGLFFAIDRSFGPAQWAHLGMFIQTVMLLATEKGLATCPQEAWYNRAATIRAHLSIPEHLALYCGMALGYADHDHPINTLVTEREPLSEFARFAGFG